MFLTPRQLHALIYLSNIFLEENAAIQNENKIVKSKQSTSRPSATTSSAASECCSTLGSEKHSQIRNPSSQQPPKRYSAMTGGLSLNQGWSTDPAGELRFPLGPFGNEQTNLWFLTGDTYSTTYDYQHDQSSFRDFEEDMGRSSSSSMTSSMCSSASHSTQTTNRARRRGIIDADPNADILRLNIRIACCAIVLLQEVCCCVTVVHQSILIFDRFDRTFWWSAHRRL